MSTRWIRCDFFYPHDHDVLWWPQ